MARDFFSDIEDEQPLQRRSRERDAAHIPPPPPPPSPPAANSERTIRNISVPVRRQPSRFGGDIRTDARVERETPAIAPATMKIPARSRLWIWITAGISILILGVAAFLLLWRETTVLITPRTHQVTFDPTTQFTAYPEESATPGSIPYSVETITIEDSQVVAATGVEKTEDLASGTVTVFNEYSTSPVRLIKNTRFETPDGLIFKIPASVEIPGMKGATPGQVQVSVFASEPGPRYNVGPIDRFTLPGLKTSPDMFAKVHARSSTAFSGGFVGDKPAVSQQSLENARAEIRTRLEGKAREAATGISDGFAFPELIRITYESLPTTPDSEGSARVNERAVVHIPVFPSRAFASAIARAVSADAADNLVTLRPHDGLRALVSGDIPENMGEVPLVFSLEGIGTIVWDVDTVAIAEALAGREQEAFETIIGTFAGVEKAEANISPFWRSVFPKDPSDIMVEIIESQS